jgi:glycosyltransferase involved in cell wall biosynthesis
MAQAVCTIVIITKNRKEELVPAIESSLAQTAAAEVLVLDDASTDGTPELVRERFPQVHYERTSESFGYIVQRNRGAAIAKTPVIVSIDDDAAFPSPRTVEQTLAEFDHPRIGAVAIPYINVLKDETVNQKAPDDRRIYLRDSFVGTAHALRRDLFLGLGGYREMHVHQGEEGDFAIRMLEAGYVVRAGFADPIHHFESPKRDLTRLFRFNARNCILFAWHNVPMPYAPGRIAGGTVNLLRHGVGRGYPRATWDGLRAGYAEVLQGKVRREPVQRRTYRLHRWLQKNGPAPLEQVEPDLLPMRSMQEGAARSGNR